MRKKELLRVTIDKEIFLKNPLFREEFIFTDKRKREKEISFEENIYIKESIKVIFITIHLKQRIKMFLKPWESVNYTHVFEKGIRDDLLAISVSHLDRIFEKMNLVFLKARFYTENGRVFVTEIEGEKEYNPVCCPHPEKFIESPGNSYVFSDNWFIYALFGNSLSLEGIRHSIIFFEKPEVPENLSQTKPKIFIVSKENFERKFKEIKDRNVYFYIYNSEEKTRGNILTSEKDVEEIVELILKK